MQRLNRDWLLERGVRKTVGGWSQVFVVYVEGETNP